MAGVKIRRGSVLLDLGLVRAIRPLWIAWLLLMPSVAQAQFTFTTNNGAITITGYTGPGGNVTIPVLASFELWLGKAQGHSACDFTFHMGLSRYDDATEKQAH